MLLIKLLCRHGLARRLSFGVWAAEAGNARGYVYANLAGHLSTCRRHLHPPLLVFGLAPVELVLDSVLPELVRHRSDFFVGDRIPDVRQLGFEVVDEIPHQHQELLVEEDGAAQRP